MTVTVCNVFSYIEKRSVTRKKQNIRLLFFFIFTDILQMTFVNDKCLCYQKYLPEIFMQKENFILFYFIYAKKKKKKSKFSLGLRNFKSLIYSIPSCS